MKIDMNIIDTALGDFNALRQLGPDSGPSPLECAIFLEELLGVTLREDEITQDNLGGSEAMRRLAASKIG